MVQETLPEWINISLTLFGIVTVGTVSAVLIEYSQPLAYLGLVIIFGFNALTAIKLHTEKKLREFV